MKEEEEEVPYNGFLNFETDNDYKSFVEFMLNEVSHGLYLDDDDLVIYSRTSEEEYRFILSEPEDNRYGYSVHKGTFDGYSVYKWIIGEECLFREAMCIARDLTDAKDVDSFLKENEIYWNWRKNSVHIEEE